MLPKVCICKWTLIMQSSLLLFLVLRWMFLHISLLPSFCAWRHSYTPELKHCPAPPRGETWHWIWTNALWCWHLNQVPSQSCSYRLQDHRCLNSHFCQPFSKTCCMCLLYDFTYLIQYQYANLPDESVHHFFNLHIW